eukprot:sb/3474717/
MLATPNSESKVCSIVLYLSSLSLSLSLSLSRVGSHSQTVETKSTKRKCLPITLIQSDPDLVTSSGERVLGTKSGLALNRVNFLYRGKFILSLNRGVHSFLYRGKFILSLNRGVTKSGATKSGSDSIDVDYREIV